LHFGDSLLVKKGWVLAHPSSSTSPHSNIMVKTSVGRLFSFDLIIKPVIDNLLAGS